MLLVNIDEKVNLFLQEVEKYILNERLYIKDEDKISSRLRNIFDKRCKVRFKNINTNKHKTQNIENMSSEEEQCIAVIKSGKNKGNLCNKNVYMDKYCKVHCKRQTEEDEEYSSESNDEVDPIGVVNTIEKEKKESKEEVKMVIAVNRFGNFVYGDTGLVFSEDKRIIAREGVNGEWLTLKQEDIELCKKYKLRYKLVEHQKSKPEDIKAISSKFSILSNEWED